MLRAIIINGEEKERIRLKKQVESPCMGVSIIHYANSVSDGVKSIQRLLPDLIFLDTELPGHSGFELFEYLPKLAIPVIFTASLERYALKAFKYSAVDYLLKPIDKIELQAAIHRVHELNKRPRNTHSSHSKLGLPTLDGYTYVRLTQLIRCEADSNYTRFYTLNGEKILVPKTMKEYEGLLSKANFLRIHRSHIINLDYVKKYTKSRIPSVTMEDGTRISVSLRMKGELLGRLG